MTTILFDTDCVLCSGWVHFVLRYEKEPEAIFVSAWSDEGKALAATHSLTEADLDQTLLVVKDGLPLTRSDAIFSVLETLHAPWSWARWLALVPRPIRDWMYGQIARRRYLLFGRRTQCFVPPPELAHRFVSAGERPGLSVQTGLR